MAPRFILPLTAVTLMVFYVFALQCVSTVAIVRRETNSWKWPVFQWLYMGALAWGLAFITHLGGRIARVPLRPAAKSRSVADWRPWIGAKN